MKSNKKIRESIRELISENSDKMISQYNEVVVAANSSNKDEVQNQLKDIIRLQGEREAYSKILVKIGVKL